jgi:hypothetical protein
MSAPKPTLSDVAALTDTHRNTVSKILKGEYDGDAATIERVKAGAAELGYVLPSKPLSKVATSDVPLSDEDLPEGVTVVVPEEKCSSTHNWTMRYSIEVTCDWEYDVDDHGNKILETERPCGTEMQHFQQCLSERPTLKEINRIIAGKRASIPEAV